MIKVAPHCRRSRHTSNQQQPQPTTTTSQNACIFSWTKTTTTTTAKYRYNTHIPMCRVCVHCHSIGWVHCAPAEPGVCSTTAGCSKHAAGWLANYSQQTLPEQRHHRHSRLAPRLLAAAPSAPASNTTAASSCCMAEEPVTSVASHSAPTMPNSPRISRIPTITSITIRYITIHSSRVLRRHGGRTSRTAMTKAAGCRCQMTVNQWAEVL